MSEAMGMTGVEAKAKVGRPRKRPEGHDVMFTMLIRKDVRHQLRLLSVERGLPQSQLIHRALNMLFLKEGLPEFAEE